ncbi:hypothetical protein BGZ93_009611 [Podila epicladia]|nr:hypothetical protein BGZ92_009963 [Podila epicladia]KAG0098998.1 hypothetical protein BGZ93_009611 [Podila epicladia]
MARTDISGLRDPSNLTPPNNRLAALSFYDDLLKSINSERMMYAASYSNTSGSQEQLVHDVHLHEKKASIDSQSPSIALCSSIPLTFSTGSEFDDRLSSEQLIHPFDTTPTSEPQETLHPRSQSSDPHLLETEGNMERIYIHPMDIMSLNGGLEINLTPQQESHHSKDRSSKCGSSHSQETIENWRIHVAPSSPTIPAIDDDMDHDMCATPTPISMQNGPHALHLTPTDKNGYMFGKDCQGTIPIILSAQLQHQAEQYLRDDDLYFSAADLHIPRPFYAYGQSRTQRQGSVNSSIGGYNYSTAASSPSLADSLSNPMYHQQSSAMNASIGSLPFPLRKGSLPSSISSSFIDDGLSRGGLQQHYFQTGPQQPNTINQHSQHTNLPAIPTRMRTRTPSHLNNIINRSNMADMTAQHEHPAKYTSSQQKRRSHYRSHSHHVRSSGSQNTASQWGSFGEFKDAQAGYATMIDIPPTSMSRIEYQPQESEVVVRSGVCKANMSLQEALAIDEQHFQVAGSYENTNQYRASRGPYRGPNVPDHLVHPLDLSPLLNHSQGGLADYNNQNKNYSQAQQYQHVATTSESQTWNSACVGLGLLMNNTSQIQKPQQHQETHQSNAQYYDPTHSEQRDAQRLIPIHIPLHQENSRSHEHPTDYDYQTLPYYPPPPPKSYPDQDHRHRPEMVSRMTSNATTLTHHSDRTHASTHSEATSVTTTNPTTSLSRTLDYDKRHHAYIHGGGGGGGGSEPHRSATQSTYQGHNFLHRQPSRNKKNLVVAIVPSTVY